MIIQLVAVTYLLTIYHSFMLQVYLKDTNSNLELGVNNS